MKLSDRFSLEKKYKDKDKDKYKHKDRDKDKDGACEESLCYLRHFRSVFSADKDKSKDKVKDKVKDKDNDKGSDKDKDGLCEESLCYWRHLRSVFSSHLCLFSQRNLLAGKTYASKMRGGMQLALKGFRQELSVHAQFWKMRGEELALKGFCTQCSFFGPIWRYLSHADEASHYHTHK